jgi:hypothetical protein
LKEFFANIIIFKKKLDEHFENSTRHKTRAITVLNTRDLKEFFVNIIIFKKKLDEHFENSMRHKTKAITVLNTREIRITFKLSMDMASPPWNLLLEALFLTKLS